MRIVFIILITFVLWLLFSYKLTEIPPGINGDEADIFYNAALISDTGRDSTGRLLPFLTEGQSGDWHKPVNTYLTVGIFKIFGISYFNARAATVILGILSCLLIGLLCYKYGGKLIGLLGIIFCATCPIVLIQTHLALENIAIIPFSAIWLLGMYQFLRTRNILSLFLTAFGLTFVYHSYNAGRFFAPVWMVLSYAYIVLILSETKTSLGRIFHKLVLLTIFLVPLILSIPLLEYFFDGSFWGNVRPASKPYIELIQGYIANFDLSFLFVRGDKTAYHSVANFGMFLLAGLPFFLVGIYKALVDKGFPLFVLISFLMTPMLFGTVDSLDRASRLTGIIPHFCFLSALGAVSLMNQLHKFRQFTIRSLFFALLLSLGAFFVYNFSDFVNYYWNEYEANYRTKEAFTDLTPQIFELFSQEVKKRKRTPFIEEKILLQKTKSSSVQFFSSIYFGKEYHIYKQGEQIPVDSLVLSLNGDIPGMKIIEPKLPFYGLMIKGN